MNRNKKKTKHRLIQTLEHSYSVKRQVQQQRSITSNNRRSIIKVQRLNNLNRSSANFTISTTPFQILRKKVYLQDSSNTISNKKNDSNVYSNERNDSSVVLNQKIGVNHNQLIKQYEQKTDDLLSKHRYLNKTKSVNGVSNKRSTKVMGKLTKIAKQLNLQFQNQLYWNGNNTYLVTGVKNQYQKIKKNFQQKCQQLEKVKQQAQVATIQQMKIYIQKLQFQNNRLLNMLQKQRTKSLKNKSKITPQKLLTQKQTLNQAQVNNQQSQDTIQNLRQKTDQLLKITKKNKILQKQNYQLNMKISILDKIIIQNQNSQFHANSKSRKLQNQQFSLKQKIKQLELTLINKQKSFQQQIQKIKNQKKGQFDIQRSELKQRINQQNTKIIKIQKNVQYLQNLLQCWQNKQKPNHRQQNSYKNLQIDHKKKQKTQSKRIQANQSQNLTKIEQNEIQNKKTNNQSINPNSNNNINMNLNIENKRISYSKINQSQGNMNQKKQDNQRKRVTALQHKQGSIKCRPVELSQIQTIVEYLKLKLIYQKIDANKLKTYFNYAGTNQVNTSIKSQDKLKDEQKLQNQKTSLLNDHPLKWQEQYISIKQVYHILMNDPFKLQQNDSLLLSRFLIEDVIQPYIYMNWDSQNSRIIVKSIISNVFANYQLLSQTQIFNSENLLKKYEINLMPALKTVTGRSAKITSEKFIQIINGLGLERSKQTDCYLLGKMCSYSRNLRQLQFQKLYNQ